MDHDKDTPQETTEEKLPPFEPGKRLSKSTLTKVVIGAVTIVVVLLIVVIKQNFPEQKIFGRVGDHTIYQSEVDETLEGSSGVSQEKVLAALMDKWLFVAIAKDQGISVSEEEINQKYLSRGGGKPSSLGGKYIKVAAERDVYKDKLQEALNGYYKGRFITARFDEHLPIIGAPVVRGKPKPSDAQREQLIREDKAYAEKLINDISQKLKTDQITFDQAMEIQRNDPKLGVKAQPTSPQSGPFNTNIIESYITTILAQSEPQTILSSLKVGDFSEPFIGKIPLGDAKDAPMAEGAWIIVQLDESKKKIDGFDNFDDLVTSYKNKIGYKVKQ